MQFSTALKSAAVLTAGLIVGGCAVRVRPATLTYTAPEVVVERPVIDVHVSRPVIVEQRRDIVVNRPIVVEKKTVVVQQKPVIVEKKTTVVVDKNHHDNGNHNGNDKFSNPAARGDNGNHYGQDKDKDKKGVAKSD
jgi:hypothetical protein